MKKRIVVLASGMGSNFVALAEYIRKKKVNADIVGLLSDNPESNALIIALSLGIPSLGIIYEKENRDELNEKLYQKLIDHAPDIIVTAGYMKLLPDFIVQEYENRIINIHPSLLPAFQGMHAIRRAFEYGVKITGCTTHFVDSTLDGGKVILQTIVKILPGMSESDLTKAIQKEEHKLLPKTVHLFVDEKIKIEGRNIRILDEK